MASDTAAGARGKLWVFGPVRDLLLLVATPILILPLAFALEGRETPTPSGSWSRVSGLSGTTFPG